MKVAKFGGSSVADAGQFRKVREIIASDPERRIVVVSAPGKRASGDAKVTDLLILCARRVLGGHDAVEQVDQVIERYSSIAADLNLKTDLPAQFKQDLHRRLSAAKTHSSRFEDSVKAAGEEYCAKLMAAYLAASGLEAAYCDPREAGLIVTEEYGRAQVMEESYWRLASLRQRVGVVVFPGFYGYSPEGHLVTFSRGGSDLTGAILAAAVHATVYENFTDVDGVAAADPRIVKDPAPIPALTYQELRELSYGGFSVFHEEAMLPTLKASIPINVRNTNHPAHPGTLVIPKRDAPTGNIIGIAADKGFCAINVGKYLMNREKGFGRRLLQILEDENLSWDHAPSGIDNISIVLKGDQLDERTEARIKERIVRELDADSVTISPRLALLSVVGDAMQQTVGLGARVFGALARAGINVDMAVHGPSEITLILGVDEVDAVPAVRAVYGEFFPRGQVRG